MPILGDEGFLAGWEVSPFLDEFPFASRDEVIEMLPGYLQQGDSRVRDAIADGALLALNVYASDKAGEAAQTDPAYATGKWLDLIGEKIAPRVEGDTDDTYRERVLVVESAITPHSIIAAIDTILEPLGVAGRAYYTELPDDEAYVFDPNTTVNLDGSITGSNTDGAYFVDGEGCLDYPDRLWEARTRCTPRHLFVFGVFRDPTTRALGVDAGLDYTQPFAQWGHSLIHLPPFNAPDEDDPVAATMVSMPSSVIDVSGALTTDAQDADAVAGDLFLLVTADATYGACVFSAQGDGAAAIRAIQSLLERRTQFPNQFTIVLDPELA